MATCSVAFWVVFFHIRDWFTENAFTLSSFSKVYPHFLKIISKTKIKRRLCSLPIKMKSRQKDIFSFLTRRNLIAVFYYIIFIHLLELTLCICLPNLSHICCPISIKPDKQDQVSKTVRFIRALHNWSNLAAIHLLLAALMGTCPLVGGYTT